MYYGLVKRKHAYDIVDAVVDVLGGSGNASRLLLETAQQETHLGDFRDPTQYGAGTGLCQSDEMPFYDVIARIRQRHLDKIEKAFAIDMRKVKWRELENSPLLAFITCRLHYKLIPAPIPNTTAERAQYWKSHYNTSAGKGTVEEYLKNAKKV